ncbi:MAG: Ig-like domain-containing protein [Candidatus Cryptobacteroides sp.]
MKNILKKTVVSLLGVVLLLSCKENIPLVGVRVSPDSLELIEGMESKRLYLYLYPSYTTDSDVIWCSEPEGIVEVDDNGNVIPVSQGTAEISVCQKSRVLASVIAVVRPFIHLESISLSENEINVSLGEKGITLKVSLVPENATNPTVLWSSSDERVVMVDASGTLSYTGIGTATVKATAADGGIFAECIVNVSHTYVEGVTVEPSSLTLFIGGQPKKLTAAVSPANASVQDVSWSSDNVSVAKVDADGNVSAVSIGFAKISATSKENKNIVGYCDVEVRAQQEKGDNILKNPGFEAPDDGQDAIANDWNVVPEEWFSAYYGTDAVTLGVPQRSNNKGNFFKTGNGKSVPEIVTGNYVGRLPAAASSGMYQIVDVVPGNNYCYGANVALVEVNANQRIKDDESMKILSVDGLTLYSSVPMPSRDKDKTIVHISGEFTVPHGVTKVRLQFDSRDYLSPAQNRAPLIMIDECELCELK